MPGLTFSELLFADDTLIFATPGHSLEAFLWAVESVSSAYGLKLNQTKCARMSLKPLQETTTMDLTAMPVNEKQEYLGAIMNAKAHPAMEIQKRIMASGYIWRKLKDFWRRGLVSKREKLLIYDTLISSRLCYGLCTLPLKEDHFRSLDAFHLKGLRQILHIAPTFMDRSQTNQSVYDRATEELQKEQKDDERTHGKRKTPPDQGSSTYIKENKDTAN